MCRPCPRFGCASSALTRITAYRPEPHQANTRFRTGRNVSLFTRESKSSRHEPSNFESRASTWPQMAQIILIRELRKYIPEQEDQTLALDDIFTDTTNVSPGDLKQSHQSLLSLWHAGEICDGFWTAVAGLPGRWDGNNLNFRPNRSWYDFLMLFDKGGAQ